MHRTPVVEPKQDFLQILFLAEPHRLNFIHRLLRGDPILQ